MKKALFDYKDYKIYLSDIIGQMPNNGRGERSKIAHILHCNIAYISQVLNGNANLSVEQGDVLNQYLGHTSDEADFFLLLVQFARAGTKSLQEHYLKKINQIVETRTLLKNRLSFKKELSKDVQPTYYSAWYYSAVHFLLAIPQFQTKDAICAHLSLPANLVGNILDFLVSEGLAIQKGNRYEIGLTHIHLGADSPMISKHHMNWRLQAMQSLEKTTPKELHYSSVTVLEESLVPHVKEVLVRAIEEIRRTMKPTSKNENLYCYTIDFFQVGSSKLVALDNNQLGKRRKHGEASSTSSSSVSH